MRFVRHPEKTKLNGETTMHCFPDYRKSFETPCRVDAAHFFTSCEEYGAPVYK